MQRLIRLKICFLVFLVLNVSTALANNTIATKQVNQLNLQIKNDGSSTVNNQSLQTSQNSNQCAFDINQPEIIVKLKNPSSNNLSLAFNTKQGSKKISKKSLAKFKNYKVRNTGLRVKKVKRLVKKVKKNSGFQISNQQQNLRSSFGLDRLFIFQLSTGIKAKNLTGISNQTNFTCEEVLDFLAELQNEPEVEYAEINKIITLDLIPNDTHYSRLWGMQNINAEAAWDLSQGEDVVVAVVDSGVDYNHPDLWDNIWLDPSIVSDNNADGKLSLEDLDANDDGVISSDEFIPEMLGYDFYDNDGDPMDLNFHGTHVAGTIAARANNNLGVVGVAPKAKIMSLRFLGPSGSGLTSDAIDAIIWATDHGAQVTNNSWGAGGSSIFLQSAFDYAKASGVINIAAAGNDNNDASSFTPANVNGVITVAALDSNNQRASFSNYGNSVDIVAPGVSIYSTSLNNGYSYASGTSMAAPHVAGLVAQMLAIDPRLSSSEVLTLIKSNSQAVSTDKYVGAGLIDAEASLDFSDSIPKVKINSSTLRSDNGSSLLDVYGSASSDDFISYSLGVYQNRDDNQALVSSSSFSPVSNGLLASLDLAPLTKNDLYTIRLDHFDINGDITSDFSEKIIVNQAPAAPSNLKQSSENIYPDKMAAIEWQQSILSDEEITAYQIYRSSEDEAPSLISEKPILDYKFMNGFIQYHSDKYMFIDKNLEPGKTYTYSVKAKNTFGASLDSSPESSITTDLVYDFDEATITNFAFTEASKFTLGGEDGPLALNKFGGVIEEIVFDNGGDIWLLDRRTIKKIDMKTKEVTTIAGSNQESPQRVTGDLSETRMFWPNSFVYDEIAQKIYVISNFNGMSNGAALTLFELVELDLANNQSRSLFYQDQDTVTTGEKVDQYSKIFLDKNRDIILCGNKNITRYDKQLGLVSIIDFEDHYQIAAGSDFSAGKYSYNSEEGKFYFYNSLSTVTNGFNLVSSLSSNGNLANELDLDQLPDDKSKVISASFMQVYKRNQFLLGLSSHQLGLLDLNRGKVFTLAGSHNIEDALNDINQVEGAALDTVLFAPTAISLKSENEVYISTGYITNDDRESGSISYARPNIKKLLFDSNQVLTTPSAVTGLTARYSNGIAALEWTAPNSDGGALITSYELYKGKEPTNLELIASTQALNYLDNGDLSEGEIYFYQVNAKNFLGEGQGAQFTLEIPLVNSPEPAPSPAPSPAPVPSPAPPATSPRPNPPQQEPIPEQRPETEKPDDSPVETPPEDEQRQVIPQKLDDIKRDEDHKNLFDLIKQINNAEKKDSYNPELDMNSDGLVDANDKDFVTNHIGSDSDLANVVKIHELLSGDKQKIVTKKSQRKLLKRVRRAKKVSATLESGKELEETDKVKIYDLNGDNKISDEEFNLYKEVLKPKKKKNRK